LAEVETARLRLRRFTADDFEQLSTLQRDPDVMRYLGTGQPREESQIRAGLEMLVESWRGRAFGMWAVELKERAGAVLGWCGLKPLEGGEEIEVSYGFGKTYWGQGIATEAARESVRFGFEDGGLERIVAVAYHSNAGSRRVMEKIGMKHVRDGFFYGANMVYYAITRAEFQANALNGQTE
jgi:ribosomal-protein-alanine N-acetyltransferase